MLTLRTATPIITEPLAAPVLCLTGKAPAKGNTVKLSHIDTPANMNFWPLFHNGVANGLRITPDAQNIDSTWIIFNQPKSTISVNWRVARLFRNLISCGNPLKIFGSRSPILGAPRSS